MLVITGSAAEAIRAMLSALQAPKEAAIRVCASKQRGGRAGPAHELTVNDRRLPGDQVVQERGVTVLVPRDQAAELVDKALDARVVAGAPRFRIVERSVQPREETARIGSGEPAA